jgi:plasmid stabilization system protein ParE
MNWTVIWKTDAESDLAALWTGASDKAAVTEAANQIDLLLRHDPLNTGESRAEDDRIHFEPPLAILFTVDELDRKVFVIRVWRPS